MNEKSGRHMLRVVLVAVLLVALLFTIPSTGEATPFSEHIRAYYPADTIGFRIEGHMQYSPDTWYFDHSKSISFNISISLPAESTLSLNVTRVFFFLYFYDDYYIHSLLNETNPASVRTNQSLVLCNLTDDYTVDSSEVSEHFIIDDFGNSAALGFLVVFDANLSENTLNTSMSGKHLFSYKIEGENWSGFPELPTSNADYVNLVPFSFIGFMSRNPGLVVVIMFAIMFGAMVLGEIKRKIKQTQSRPVAEGTQEMDEYGGRPLTNDELQSLVAQDESQYLERKPYLRWNERKQAIDKGLEYDVAESIAGFMNANTAVLIIGQIDSGEVIGVESEYAHIPNKKKDQEGFEFRVRDVVNTLIGQSAGSLISVTILQVQEHDVCFIQINESPEPVWVRKDGAPVFPVRQGKRTQKLNAKAQNEYIRHRWG